MLLRRTDVHLGGMSSLPLEITSILLSLSSLSPVSTSSVLAIGGVSLLA
jgi:hypothetical protein